LVNFGEARSKLKEKATRDPFAQRKRASTGNIFMPSAEEVLMATAGGAGEAPGDASTVFTYCVVDPDDEDATSPFLAFPEEAKGAGEILVLSDGGGNIKGWWSAKRSVAVTKQLQGITGASDEICVMFARLERWRSCPCSRGR
jgi:hypothetical protein